MGPERARRGGIRANSVRPEQAPCEGKRGFHRRERGGAALGAVGGALRRGWACPGGARGGGWSGGGIRGARNRRGGPPSLAPTRPGE